MAGRPHGRRRRIRIRSSAATPRRRCREQLAGTLVLTERRRTARSGRLRRVGQARSGIRAVLFAAAADGNEAALARPGAGCRAGTDPESDAVRLSGARHEGRRLRGPWPAIARRTCAWLAYTAGVLSSFAAMAAAVVAIRASVGEVSWGFQFQSPVSRCDRLSFLRRWPEISGVFEIGSRFAGVARAWRGAAARPRLLHRRAGRSSSPLPAPVPSWPRRWASHLSQPAPQTVAVLLALGWASPCPIWSPRRPRHAAPDAAYRCASSVAFPMYASRLDDLGADPADRRRRVIYALGILIPCHLVAAASAAAPRSPRGCAATGGRSRAAAFGAASPRPATAASPPTCGRCQSTWER